MRYCNPDDLYCSLKIIQMNKVVITISERSFRVTVSEDLAKKASRKEKPNLVKAYILKEWTPDE